MATRVLPFTVTIPPETLASAPVSIPINLDGWTVEALDLEVPPGPSGLMGFQIYNNGVAWIPYGPGNWLVWDDNTERYYLDNQPDAGGWAVVGYNDGVYPHNVTVRAHVSPAVTADSSTPTPTVTFVTTDVTATESVTS
jgi:hypothetical protein